MSDATGQRPDRTSMQGMIWNANHILTKTLDPDSKWFEVKLDPWMFGSLLKGICFISCVQAGFIFSGHVGTGIVLARQEDGQWSPPSAIGLTGVGWGIMMGASVQDIVYLIYDDSTLKAMSGDVGFKLGVKTEAAFLNWGRTAEATNQFSNKGIGTNIALSFSKGVFGGLSVEGGVVNPRSAINEMFYGKKVSPSDILFTKGAVTLPPEGHLMHQVYDKLDKLNRGIMVWTPTQEELDAIEAARVAAYEAGEEMRSHDDVIHVNAEEEAKNEAK